MAPTIELPCCLMSFAVDIALPCQWGGVPEEVAHLRYRERFEPLLPSDTIRTARQACTVINNELMKYSICIPERSMLPVTLAARLLMNIKFGLCGDYANLAVFAMRSAGIPVGIETVFYWGQGNGRHTFNVVYDDDSTFHEIFPVRSKIRMNI